jgi:hypothetical protein
MRGLRLGSGLGRFLKLSVGIHKMRCWLREGLHVPAFLVECWEDLELHMFTQELSLPHFLRSQVKVNVKDTLG